MSEPRSFDLIVIGSGPGGYVCAIKAAQLGLSVACIEKDSTLGGTCLNVGCIPSKAMLESSHLFDEANSHFAQHGIQCTPELDLPTMLKRKEGVVGGFTRGIVGLFKKNGVTEVHGLGRFAGSDEQGHRIEVVENDAVRETLIGKRVVVATGSSPATIPGVEFDGERIVSSTEALSFDAVPEHLIVIGAGIIGLELGSVWRRLGAKVTVLEYLDRIIPGSDGEIAKQALRAFKRQGMKFKLGVRVTGAENLGEGVRVSYQKGEQTETIDGDLLLVAVGRRPHTTGLGAETIGLALDRRGRIEIDAHYATNVPGVYAIGDVVKGPMLAHKAEDEGVAIAELLAGKAGHVNYDAIPGVVYTQPEIAWVGQTEEELKAANVPYRSGSFPFSANGRARALAQTQGIAKVLAHAETDRILGVHIIGPVAGELVAEAVLAMEFGASSEDLARTCHSHPTLGEALREAAMGVTGPHIRI